MTLLERPHHWHPIVGVATPARARQRVSRDSVLRQSWTVTRILSKVYCLFDHAGPEGSCTLGWNRSKLGLALGSVLIPDFECSVRLGPEGPVRTWWTNARESAVEQQGEKPDGRGTPLMANSLQALPIAFATLSSSLPGIEAGPALNRNNRSTACLMLILVQRPTASSR